MKAYTTEFIRNLAVIGHGDVGKTQLISSLLYVAGATPRWGKVDEGTTVTDYEEDSIARKITLNTALAHLDHRDTKITFIDTPGYAAFVAHARPALRVDMAQADGRSAEPRDGLPFRIGSLHAVLALRIDSALARSAGSLTFRKISSPPKG